MGRAAALILAALATGSVLAQEPAIEATQVGVSIVRCLVYRDGRPMVSADEFEAIARAIRAVAPDAIVGCGTVGSFAELNRNRPPTRSAAVLAWSVCPQVHGSDDDTLIESLQGLGAAVGTARSFAPTAHLAVGPICFWRTPDPFAAGNDGTPRPAIPDVRLHTAFGAAWTLGCISTLANARADSMTLYQTNGALGVNDGNTDAPLYNLFREIGEFAHGQVLECVMSEPLRIAALAIRLGGLVRVWIASMASGETEIKLTGLFGGRLFRFSGVEVKCHDFDLLKESM